MNTASSGQDLARFDSIAGRESKLVSQFFGQRAHGVYLDVGANHPYEQSQTWHWELNGWSGVLVEPDPALCQLLRERRPGSITVQAAACSPAQVGEADGTHRMAQNIRLLTSAATWLKNVSPGR